MKAGGKLGMAAIFGLPFAALAVAFAVLQLDLAPAGSPSAAVLLRGESAHLASLAAPGQDWRRGLEATGLGAQVWTLVSAQGAGCGPARAEEQLAALDLALRVEAALGRQSVRLRRVHLSLPGASPLPPEVLRDTSLVRLQGVACPPAPRDVSAAAGGLWVADHAGALVAWLPPDAQGADLVRDLKAFLRTPPKPTTAPSAPDATQAGAAS